MEHGEEVLEENIQQFLKNRWNNSKIESKLVTHLPVASCIKAPLEENVEQFVQNHIPMIHSIF